MPETIRFVHSSDWQIGMTRAFMRGDAAPRFAQDRIDAVKRLGELAAAHDARFMIVAGDVFDSNQLGADTLGRTLDALESVPVPVFLLPGNHDPLDGGSIFSPARFASAPDNVIVLRDTTPIPVPGLDGVEVVGAPWRTKRPDSDPCADMLGRLPPKTGRCRVAVAHGQVLSFENSGSGPAVIDLDAVRSALADGRIDYLGLGDKHSFEHVTDDQRVVFSGSPVMTDFRDTQSNCAALVTLDEAGCRAEPLTVGDWRFERREFPMNGNEDIVEFQSWLAAVPPKSRSRTNLRYWFRGALNVSGMAELEAVEADWRERFASFERRDAYMDLTLAPDAFDEDAVALSGYARAAWQELMAGAESGDETDRDALLLLYRWTRSA